VDYSLFVLERACHFKHSVELVDREGNIVDVLAAEDFLLAQATYQPRDSDGQRSAFG
jgi:hypothetical protein